MNKQTKEDGSKIFRIVLFFIIMCILFIPLSFWLYDKSALGNPLCEEMSAQGYYETEWDTAGHESCITNYKKGADECNGIQKFMNIDPKDCYTGSINQTCMDNRFEWDSKNITSYGWHCVWGGPGYWAFVGAMAIPYILFAIFGMIIATIWSSYKMKKNKEVVTCRSM